MPFELLKNVNQDSWDRVRSCLLYLPYSPVYCSSSSLAASRQSLARSSSSSRYDQTIDINCKGVLNGIAAVLPQMLDRKQGHIVNISSDAGRKVFAGLGVYSASKMFVEAVSQALRLENVGSGLRVTTIQVRFGFG